ncbi:hypothetical protein MUK42_20545 [Musa troglodytarum]|uniref:Uncharacterized protein n=1 Tax=Musa troglodytarum TaxID=320322 RepID=A0A9E7FZ74_9LILI|nr:hypothetical protein MUK42_20545 [Musa troglodytarum]
MKGDGGWVSVSRNEDMDMYMTPHSIPLSFNHHNGLIATSSAARRRRSMNVESNPRELMGRSESRRHLLMHIPPPPTDDKGRLLPNASEQPSVAGVH